MANKDISRKLARSQVSAVFSQEGTVTYLSAIVRWIFSIVFEEVSEEIFGSRRQQNTKAQKPKGIPRFARFCTEDKDISCSCVNSSPPKRTDRCRLCGSEGEGSDILLFKYRVRGGLDRQWEHSLSKYADTLQDGTMPIILCVNRPRI